MELLLRPPKQKVIHDRAEIGTQDRLSCCQVGSRVSGLHAAAEELLATEKRGEFTESPLSKEAATELPQLRPPLDDTLG